MKIKIIRGKFRDTIHEARMIHKGLFQQPEYQVTEGQLQGMIIDYMDCIVVDEGKTYTEAEYNELAKKVTKLEEDRTYLLKEINVLKADKQLLLETIEEEERNSKVELPIEVAEAIESIKSKGFSNYFIIKRYFNQIGNSNDLTTVIKYIDANPSGFDNLLRALVNGFTVKDKQTELEEQVYKMIFEWEHADYDGDAEDDRKQLATRLTSFIKENLQAT